MNRILLVLALMLSGFQVVAQDKEVEVEEEGEVIVISELNRNEVRQFIEEAEDQFYAIFNANVDDDDYKITCRKEAPTGSNISVRVCEPEFMIRARADNMNSFQFNRGTEQSNSAIRAGLQPEYERLQAKMEQMTREIPGFAQIAGILTQLRARLDQLTN